MKIFKKKIVLFLIVKVEDISATEFSSFLKFIKLTSNGSENLKIKSIFEILLTKLFLKLKS